MKEKNKLFDFETILNNVISGIIVSKYDEAFTLVYTNDGLYNLIGYTREEIDRDFGGSYEPTILEADSYESDKNLENQLKEGDRYTIKYRVKTKDGKILWILENGIRIYDEHGDPYLQYILTDITAQVTIEEELRIIQKKYEIAMDYSNVTTFEYNVKTNEIITNETDFETFVMPKTVGNCIEEILNSGFIEDQSKEAFSKLYSEIDDGAVDSQATIYTNGLDGMERILEIKLTSIFDEKGIPIRAVGVLKDITENSLLQREKEYSKTMSSGQILMLEANLNKDLILAFDHDWAKFIGVAQMTSFSEAIKHLAKNKLHPDDRKKFSRIFTIKHLTGTFEKGNGLVSIEYRRLVEQGEYHWFKNNVSIIKDRLSGDLIVRCYLNDINREKMKEIKALEEKRLFESMLTDKTLIYAINLTKNQFTSGYEKLPKLFSSKVTNNYSSIIQIISSNLIHPEDKASYMNKFSLNNLLNSFTSGITNISYEHRRLNEEGEFIWVRNALHMFEEPESGEIKAHVYVEDINSEKVRELELVYNAEHDMLTGLLNKRYTEIKITEFLCTGESKIGVNAFFIMDIDNFKEINDTFGHAFGDVVLSKTARRLAEIFRDEDILGRIGGDEFAILVKNMQSEKKALSKAQEICDKCRDSYNQNGIIHRVSLSIGIAFYGIHGKTYEEIYKHSDAALYISKENGRDCFTVYSDNMVVRNSNVNDIYENQLLEPRLFEKNIAEYVFRILYESANKESAINSVLELIGKHFDVSRAYVFEEIPYSNYTSNTFEWCNEGIVPQKRRLKKISNEELGNQRGRFNESGIYFLPEVSRAEESQKNRLGAQGIKSMLQFSIVIGGEYRGLIGFDECRAVRVPSKKKVSDMQNVANILGVFIMEMRAAEEKEATRAITLSIVNGLNSFAYVCDPDSYRILFANERTIAAIPTVHIGSICYKAFFDRNESCEACPMKALQSEKNHFKNTNNMEDSKFAEWVKISASWIAWVDGNKMCLLDVVDITEFKEKN